MAVFYGAPWCTHRYAPMTSPLLAPRAKSPALYYVTLRYVTSSNTDNMHFLLSNRPYTSSSGSPRSKSSSPWRHDRESKRKNRRYAVKPLSTSRVPARFNLQSQFVRLQFDATSIHDIFHLCARETRHTRMLKENRPRLCDLLRSSLTNAFTIQRVAIRNGGNFHRDRESNYREKSLRTEMKS